MKTFARLLASEVLEAGLNLMKTFARLLASAVLEAGLNQMKILQGYLHKHSSVRSGPEKNENFCKVTCISTAVLEAGLI